MVTSEGWRQCQRKEGCSAVTNFIRARIASVTAFQMINYQIMISYQIIIKIRLFLLRQRRLAPNRTCRVLRKFSFRGLSIFVCEADEAGHTSDIYEALTECLEHFKGSDLSRSSVCLSEFRNARLV